MVLFDAPVASRNGHFPNAVTDLGRLFSDIGNSAWILLLTAYLVVSGFAALRTSSETDCRRDTCRLVCAAGYIFLTVALSGIVANLFKRLIGRARPVLFDEQGMFSFTPVFNSAKYQSFPSGHATTAAALFVGLAILFPRYRGLLLGYRPLGGARSGDGRRALPERRHRRPCPWCMVFAYASRPFCPARISVLHRRAGLARTSSSCRFEAAPRKHRLSEMNGSKSQG